MTPQPAATTFILIKHSVLLFCICTLFYYCYFDNVAKAEKTKCDDIAQVCKLYVDFFLQVLKVKIKLVIHFLLPASTSTTH